MGQSGQKPDCSWRRPPSVRYSPTKETLIRGLSTMWQKRSQKEGHDRAPLALRINSTIWIMKASLLTGLSFLHKDVLIEQKCLGVG